MSSTGIDKLTYRHGLALQERGLNAQYIDASAYCEVIFKSKHARKFHIPVTEFVNLSIPFASQPATADEYFNDLADLVDYYDNNPQSDGYVIMIDEVGNGDFQYVFMEIDNVGIVNVANNFDSSGNSEGIDPSSYGVPMGDYIDDRGLSLPGPYSCTFEIYCTGGGGPV